MIEMLLVALSFTLAFEGSCGEGEEEGAESIANVSKDESGIHYIMDRNEYECHYPDNSME